MTRLAIFCVAAFGAISILRAQSVSAEATPLNAAVEDFNERTHLHPIGKTQPPLTNDEVIAAIRGWIPEMTTGVTDDIYDTFQAVAESRELPEGGNLSFCSGWTGYRGYRFTVWWIDLSIKTGEKTRYGFRIRDQKISSRKMTADELAKIEKRNRDDLPD